MVCREQALSILGLRVRSLSLFIMSVSKEKGHMNPNCSPHQLLPPTPRVSISEMLPRSSLNERVSQFRVQKGAGVPDQATQEARHDQVQDVAWPAALAWPGWEALQEGGCICPVSAQVAAVPLPVRSHTSQKPAVPSTINPAWTFHPSQLQVFLRQGFKKPRCRTCIMVLTFNLEPSLTKTTKSVKLNNYLGKC